jgi:hypothetical protein
MSSVNEPEKPKSGSTFGSIAAGMAAGVAAGIGGSGVVRTAPAAAEAIIAGRAIETKADTPDQAVINTTAVQQTVAAASVVEPVELPDLESLLAKLRDSVTALDHHGKGWHIPDAPAAEEGTSDEVTAGDPTTSTFGASIDTQSTAEQDVEDPTITRVQAQIDEVLTPLAALLVDLVDAHVAPQLREPSLMWLSALTASIEKVPDVQAQGWPAVRVSIDQAVDSFNTGYSASVATSHQNLMSLLEQKLEQLPDFTQRTTQQWESDWMNLRDSLKGTFADVDSRVNAQLEELRQHATHRADQLKEMVKDEILNAIKDRLARAISEHLAQAGVAASANAAIVAFAPTAGPFLQAVEAAARLKEELDKVF